MQDIPDHADLNANTKSEYQQKQELIDIRVLSTKYVKYTN